MEMLGDISWHEPGKEVRSKTDNISINLHALKQHSRALKKKKTTSVPVVNTPTDQFSSRLSIFVNPS